MDQNWYTRRYWAITKITFNYRYTVSPARVKIAQKVLGGYFLDSYRIYTYLVTEWTNVCAFLPRCMECRRGLAMRILSVCLSVRLSVCVRLCAKRVICKRKKVAPAFLWHMKDHLPLFCDKKNGWWRDPIYLKCWANRPPLEWNRRFWSDIWP